MTAEVFKQKYMSYHQKMYRVAYRLVGDACDAEDMVQEAYIKLWNKRNELLCIENQEAYCIAILRNLCFDFLRASNRHQTKSTEDVVVPDHLVLSSEIEANDEIKHIEFILAQLPKRQEQVMKLKHFDDCSSEEIEQIMELSAVNVRVLLSRARKKFRELFEKQCNYGR